MLTSKQRAYLRSLAVDLDTVLMVGKGGLSPALIKQAVDAREARELIKGKVLQETSPISARDAAEQIGSATSSEVVQVIGSKFVLFRQKKKDSAIQLPRAARQV